MCDLCGPQLHHIIAVWIAMFMHKVVSCVESHMPQANPVEAFTLWTSRHSKVYKMVRCSPVCSLPL